MIGQVYSGDDVGVIHPVGQLASTATSKQWGGSVL